MNGSALVLLLTISLSSLPSGSSAEEPPDVSKTFAGQAYTEAMVDAFRFFARHLAAPPAR